RSRPRITDSSGSFLLPVSLLLSCSSPLPFLIFLSYQEIHNEKTTEKKTKKFLLHFLQQDYHFSSVHERKYARTHAPSLWFSTSRCPPCFLQNTSLIYIPSPKCFRSSLGLAEVNACFASSSLMVNPVPSSFTSNTSWSASRQTTTDTFDAA